MAPWPWFLSSGDMFSVRFVSSCNQQRDDGVRWLLGISTLSIINNFLRENFSNFNLLRLCWKFIFSVSFLFLFNKRLLAIQQLRTNRDEQIHGSRPSLGRGNFLLRFIFFGFSFFWLLIYSIHFCNNVCALTSDQVLHLWFHSKKWTRNDTDFLPNPVFSIHVHSCLLEAQVYLCFITTKILI